MDLNKTSLVAPSMFEAGLGLPPRSRGVSPSRLPLPRAQTPEISSVRFSGLPGSKTRPPSSLRGPVSVAGRVGRCPPSTRAEGGTAGGHSEVLVVLRAAPRGGREVRPEASTRLPGPGAEGGWSRCSGGVGGGKSDVSRGSTPVFACNTSSVVLENHVHLQGSNCIIHYMLHLMSGEECSQPVSPSLGMVWYCLSVLHCLVHVGVLSTPFPWQCTGPPQSNLNDNAHGSRLVTGW